MAGANEANSGASGGAPHGAPSNTPRGTPSNTTSNTTGGAPIVGEDAIIEMLRPLSAPGAFDLRDDCAAITPAPGTDLVLKTDPVAEGVHFLSSDAAQDIAWKALAVNVSDLAAKAARPIGYLMALSFPTAPQRAWLQAFADGLAQAQTHFGLALLGGDTDRRPGPITISITVLGEVERGAMLRRGAARPGDAIYVSGSIGDAHLGLKLLREPQLAVRWGLTEAQADTLRGRYRRPQPRLALAPALRAQASAAMDVSDGLVKDLGRMLRASGTAARLDLPRLPLSAAAAQAVAADPALLPELATAGDDYEVLAAVPQAHKAAFETGARQSGVAVSVVGEMTAEAPGSLQVRGRDGLEMHLQSSGWDHF